MATSQITPSSNHKILLVHSNIGTTMQQWHARMRLSAVRLGYRVSSFSMCDYHPYTIFPYLDKSWRKRDPLLLTFYDALGKAIDDCDVLIHYNGVLIHPEFLQQFKKLKIYHCADDPDASAVISKPVAANYDICAISNPACIDMYQRWGCRNIFFWPLGAFSYLDEDQIEAINDRDIPLIFIGSKFGVTNVRYIGKYLGLHRKKRFLDRIEQTFPELVAYGSGWKRGRIADDEIKRKYRQARIGLNLHNSLGPLNGRLYDLAAFGICQICDNKSTLSLVFEEGKEIVGFESIRECVDLIRYYLTHPREASEIGAAARQRFLRDYSMTAIWKGFFKNVNQVLENN